MISKNICGTCVNTVGGTISMCVRVLFVEYKGILKLLVPFFEIHIIDVLVGHDKKQNPNHRRLIRVIGLGRRGLHFKSRNQRLQKELY